MKLSWIKNCIHLNNILNSVCNQFIPTDLFSLGKRGRSREMEQAVVGERVHEADQVCKRLCIRLQQFLAFSHVRLLDSFQQRVAFELVYYFVGQLPETMQVWEFGNKFWTSALKLLKFTLLLILVYQDFNILGLFFSSFRWC